MSTSSESAGAPHKALFSVLSFLPFFELVLMSQVCKSLKDVINNDILPWLDDVDVIVEPPFNKRLSDYILMNVTSKANGRVRILDLKNCETVTDDGLLEVVEENPFISELYARACTRITLEGFKRAVRLINHKPGLKYEWRRPPWRSLSTEEAPSDN